MDDEIRNVLMGTIKQDGLLAAGTVVIGMAVQLFTLGKVWEALAYMVVGIFVFGVRTLMKADKELKRMGVDISESPARSIKDRIDGKKVVSKTKKQP